MNSPASGSMLEPVILFPPVRDTVTFPVCASPHENVSFARREILPPLPLMNVPESDTARIESRGRSVIVIFVREQFVGTILLQSMYGMVYVPTIFAYGGITNIPPERKEPERGFDPVSVSVTSVSVGILHEYVSFDRSSRDPVSAMMNVPVSLTASIGVMCIMTVMFARLQLFILTLSHIS